MKRILLDLKYLAKIDGNGNNKADFISKSITQKDYDAVKQDITQYFNSKFGNFNWYVDIKDSSKKLVMPTITNVQFSPQEQYSSTQSAFLVSSVSIPVNGQEPTYVTIELFFLK